MAVSIDQVSANASESSAVAERLCSHRQQGNEVVHTTITGMDNIRESRSATPEELSASVSRRRRLRITVSLINDIADQTNILALNAAIW
jgi:twitching motility protein PilJ